MLVNEQCRDEKSRDDEENVDSYEATAEAEEMCVVENNCDDGECAQALDVATLLDTHA